MTHEIFDDMERAYKEYESGETTPTRDAPTLTRRLHANDASVYWIYADGSHRSVSTLDLELINSLLDDFNRVTARDGIGGTISPGGDVHVQQFGRASRTPYDTIDDGEAFDWRRFLIWAGVSIMIVCAIIGVLDFIKHY